MSPRPAPRVREPCANARAAACRARVPPPPPPPDTSCFVVRFTRAPAKPARNRFVAGFATRAPAPGSAATATWGSGHHTPRMLVRGAEEAREAARNAACFTAAAGSSAVGGSPCKATGARSRAAEAVAGRGMGMPSCAARIAVSFAVPLACKLCPSPRPGGRRGLLQALTVNPDP